MTSPSMVGSEKSIDMSEFFNEDFKQKVFLEKEKHAKFGEEKNLDSSDNSGSLNVDLPSVEINPVPEFIKILEPKERPEAPYDDEVGFGGLVLGPEYPELNQELDQLMQDPKENFLKIQIVTSKISKLINTASEKKNFWHGPLNERKYKTIKNPAYKEPSTNPQEQDSSDPGRAIVLYEEQKNDRGNQKDYDTDKPDSTPTPSPEPKQPEEKKSWLKKLEDKFANTWLGRKNKDFIEYVNRHKDESKMLAWLGGFAGGTSAGLGLLAAEWAVSMAYPPLGIAVTGAAVGLAFNYAFTNIFNEVYNKPKAADELAAYKPEKHGDQKEYQEKVELDRKGRMKAFVIADIVGKVAGGIGIGLGLHHAATAGNETAPIQRGNGTLGADKLGNIHDHLAAHPVPGEAPLPPHPDLIPSNYGEMSESQLLEHFRSYLGENNWQNPGPYKDYAGRPVELADVLVRTIVANQNGLSGAEIDAIRKVASTHNLGDLIKTINQGAYRTIFG